VVLKIRNTAQTRYLRYYFNWSVNNKDLDIQRNGDKPDRRWT